MDLQCEAAMVALEVLGISLDSQRTEGLEGSSGDLVHGVGNVFGGGSDPFDAAGD